MGKSTREPSFNQEFILSSFAVLVSQEFEKVVEQRTEQYKTIQQHLEAKILHYRNTIKKNYGAEALREYDEWFEIATVKSGTIKKK